MKTAILRALKVMNWYFLFTNCESACSHNVAIRCIVFLFLQFHHDEVSHCVLLSITVDKINQNNDVKLLALWMKSLIDRRKCRLYSSIYAPKTLNIK